MRVALSGWFRDSLTTGSGQYTQRLVRALSRSAPEMELLLVAPTPTGLSTTVVAPDNTRWETGEASAARPRAGNLAKLWFEQAAFPAACRRLGADVAHVPYWAPPALAPVPTIVTIHDLIPLLLPAYRQGWRVRRYTDLVSRSAGSAALVLTDSEAARQDILTHLRLPPARVRTVPLAAGDTFGPAPSGADDAIRARLGLPSRYFLYLGGFDRRKNLATVLTAYRLVAPAIGTTCALVIAGRLPDRDTPFAPDPRRLACEGEIDTGRVQFLGAVDKGSAPTLYRGATAFIFASRYEGFGLPPLEAMACGTPVVGSNASSIPEVVGDGGVLYDPDDAEGMASALVRLSADSAFRTEMSGRALAQAARFSWARTAELTLAAYRDVLAASQ